MNDETAARFEASYLGDRTRVRPEARFRAIAATRMQGVPVLHEGLALTAVSRESFDFTGAFEQGFGACEACSLFAPMFGFEDQAAAVATAQQVLAQLRTPAPEPSRRALLFGRPAEAAR